MAESNKSLERTFDAATVLLPQVGGRVKCRSTDLLSVTKSVLLSRDHEGQ